MTVCTHLHYEGAVLFHEDTSRCMYVLSFSQYCLSIQEEADVDIPVQIKNSYIGEFVIFIPSCVYLHDIFLQKQPIYHSTIHEAY